MDNVVKNQKIKEAIELINKKSYKKALECLKIIINEKNDNPKILNLYGIVQLQLNQLM